MLIFFYSFFPLHFVWTCFTVHEKLQVQHSLKVETQVAFFSHFFFHAQLLLCKIPIPASLRVYLFYLHVLKEGMAFDRPPAE